LLNLKLVGKYKAYLIDPCGRVIGAIRSLTVAAPLALLRNAGFFQVAGFEDGERCRVDVAF
jgi:hypothetical protein